MGRQKKASGLLLEVKGIVVGSGDEDLGSNEAHESWDEESVVGNAEGGSLQARWMSGECRDQGEEKSRCTPGFLHRDLNH